MVTIQQLKVNIGALQQQQSAAEGAAQAARTPSQMQLRQPKAGVSPIQAMQQRAALVKQTQASAGQSATETQQYTKAVETYAATEAGKLQWVDENKPAPNPTKSYLDRPYFGYALEGVSVYDTPYGEVADTRALNKAKEYITKKESSMFSAFQTSLTNAPKDILPEIETRTYTPPMVTTGYGQVPLASYQALSGVKQISQPVGQYSEGIFSTIANAPARFIERSWRGLAYGTPKQGFEWIRNIIPKQEQYKTQIVPEKTYNINYGSMQLTPEGFKPLTRTTDSFEQQVPTVAENIIRTGTTVAKAAPYFIPGVGEVLLIGQAGETLLTPSGRAKLSASKKAMESANLKPWVAKTLTYGVPIVEGGLGLFGLGLRTGIIKTPTTKALSVPKGNQKVDTQIIYDRAITIKNVPKQKIIEVTADGRRISKVVKGGKILVEKPINPKVITRITSDTNKGFVLSSISDESGNVVGVITRKGTGWGIFRSADYVTKFKVSPEGKATYDIFRNGKFYKRVEDTSGKMFGFTEPIINRGINIVKTSKLPGKFKLRTMDKTKTYTQELIALNDKNIQVSGELGTFQRVERATLVTPAKANINLYKTTLNPREDVKAVWNVKKLYPKFSRENPADIETIKNRIVGENVLKATSTEAITPRFSDIVVQQEGGAGSFIIRNPNRIQRYLESGIFKSKRAGTLLAPREVITLETGVQVPMYVSKTSELSNVRLFTPSSTKEAVNVGVVSMLGTNIKPATKTLVSQTPKVESIVNVRTTQGNLIDMRSVIETKVAQDVRLDIMQITKQETKQQQQQSIRQEAQRTRQPRTPEPKIPKVPKFFGSYGKELSSKGLSSKFSSYLVKIRKQGKDVGIGEASTMKGAGLLLATKLKGTLAASGFVEEKGSKRKISIMDLGLTSREFAPSKRDIFRIVQQRGFRLGTRGEVKEIIGAKKNKPKGKKLKWL